MVQVKWVGCIQIGGIRGKKINRFRSQNMWEGRGSEEEAIEGSNEEKMSVSIKTWELIGHF